MSIKYGYLILMLFFAFGCKPNSKPSNTRETTVSVPEFNADSAYHYTETQVLFGPRVPNTPPHVECGNYLANQLRKFGANVTEQEVVLYLYDNTPINAKNIIGSFEPGKKSRILLFAHWDTRPFADHDPDPANHYKAIDGANDGAGSCGVLLEIARQISIQQPTMGIDIIFFDAEDWGAPAFDKTQRQESGYCLGSSYWARNPHVINYTARYGILLDMVGGHGAQFYKEAFSMYYASHIVQKVWDAAQTIGYSSYFKNEEIGGIDDDHVHVMEHRKIPCIDIIQYDPNSEKGFAPYWHTMDDNMDNISKETLKAVGQTVLHVVYNEK